MTYSSPKDIVLFVNMALNIIIFIILILFGLKLGHLSYLVKLISAGPASQANAAALVIRHPTLTPCGERILETIWISPIIVLIGVTAILCVFIIMAVFRLLRRDKYNTILKLIIANDSRWVEIPLITFAGHPSQHHIKCDTQFRSFYVEGYLFPRLHWKDNGLIIYNEAAKVARSIPSTKQVSKWKAMQLESLFSGDFYVYLIGVCNGTQIIYTGCLPECSICAGAADWPIAGAQRRHQLSDTNVSLACIDRDGDQHMSPLLSQGRITERHHSPMTQVTRV